MADYFDAGKWGAVFGIPFYTSNVTAGAADVDFVLGGSGTLAVMPYAGSVVGISVRANAALTAGSITVEAHAAGTEVVNTSAPVPTLTTAVQASYATIRPGAITFAAGATLGLSHSATTTLAQSAAIDLDGVLFVQLNPV